MAKRAETKSSLIYDVIDLPSIAARNPSYRSTMNVVFRLPGEELEELFIKESKKSARPERTSFGGRTAGKPVQLARACRR